MRFTGRLSRRLVPVLLALLLLPFITTTDHPAYAQAEAAATIENFAFVPATLTVAVGTTVTWTQQDEIPHTVTSGQPGAADEGSLFDSPLLELGQTFSVTFIEPGTYLYFCRPHPRMVGVVDVTGAATAVQPAAAAPMAAPAAQPGLPTMGPPPLPANAQPVATGLTNPRGFTWGPDGALYVAESGTPPPGYQPAMGPPDPNAPVVTNRNGRITRIAADGTRRTIADGLPVMVGQMGHTIGVAGVAFIGDQLYAIISAGPVHGWPDFPGGVYRVGMDGTLTLIVNTDAFNVANPAAFIPPVDELSQPYDMIAVGGRLYITDGNRDQVFEVDPAAPEGSRIRRLADLSRGHPVLTGITLGPDGNLYVTNLTPAPFPAGGGRVWRIRLGGQVSEVAAGVSAGVGIAAAPDGTLYVSEFATTLGRPPFFEPPGRIVVVDAGGVTGVVAAPMFFPNILRWGPDGLYATNFSVAGDQGNGAIQRIAVPATAATQDKGK